MKVNKKTIKSTVFIALSFWLISCTNHQQASPKPHAYPRIDFPAKTYRQFKSDECSFGFQYPDYAKIVSKTTFIDETIENPCWFDLVFPEFNGSIHCSYYAIDQKNRLDSLIYDSFALTGKHNIKAQYIKETKFNLEKKGGGMLFRITGPVASPTQFFITDSTDHFLRGSLYFNNKVKVDSMRVIYEFIDKDIDKMIESFYFY
jgi:gliding motility-associated lipoprotein GldD